MVRIPVVRWEPISAEFLDFSTLFVLAGLIEVIVSCHTHTISVMSSSFVPPLPNALALMKSTPQWHSDAAFVDPSFNMAGQQYDTKVNTATSEAAADAFRCVLREHSAQAITHSGIDWEGVGEDNRCYVSCSCQSFFPLRSVTLATETLYLYFGPVMCRLGSEDGPRLCDLTWGMAARTYDGQEFQVLAPLCWSGTEKVMHNRCVIRACPSLSLGCVMGLVGFCAFFGGVGLWISIIIH